MESLSPKEIQARIRMGASPEDLAEEAGWPLEKIQRFAAPLLAERAFIANAAQDAPLRTSTGETTLGEAVQAACFSARLPMHALEWDSWRRPDGRWVVTVSFPVGASQVRGSWAFDPRVKSLHDLDEAARWLLGESEVSLDDLVRHQTLTLPLPRMRERPLEDWEADRAEADRWRRQPGELSRSVAGDDDADIIEVDDAQNLPDEDAPTPPAIARAAARRLTVVPAPPATVTPLPRAEPEPEPEPEPDLRPRATSAIMARSPGERPPGVPGGR